MQILIGPFAQLLPLSGLPGRGPIPDDALRVIPSGGILVADGHILEIGSYADLLRTYPSAEREEIEGDMVALPGWVDAHTHICFDGSRAMDFAARNAGRPYLEIAKAGGGIWSTVQHTRAATQEQLAALTTGRLDRLLEQGVTTVEVKSGYGLSVAEEAKMLRAIQAAGKGHAVNVVATCLAAHIVPRDFDGDASAYLQHILAELVPLVQRERLCRRFDIFVEDSAFNTVDAVDYLKALKERGFDLTVHGDQFTPGGSEVAIACGARSVDHLEASGPKEIAQLAQSNVIPVALPGATIGLGCGWTPARALLDAGCALAIASDWNPGSAPQGQLLLQASLLATFQKLTTAEVLAGITSRAARALGLSDRGCLHPGMAADIVAFPTGDYRDVLYYQGSMQPCRVWVGGKRGR